MLQNEQDNLNERLHFIGMDQQARSALRHLKPFLAKAISPALKAFYDKVKIHTADTQVLRRRSPYGSCS